MADLRVFLEGVFVAVPLATGVFAGVFDGVFDGILAGVLERVLTGVLVDFFSGSIWSLVGRSGFSGSDVIVTSVLRLEGVFDLAGVFDLTGVFDGSVSNF